MRITWGTVDKNGTAVSGGNNVTRDDKGRYRINLGFSSNPPAIVGSQTRSGNLSEANTDGIVFPTLSGAGATALTGNNVGATDDRSFSFMAVGDALAPMDGLRILWGALNADGKTVSSSGGFSIGKTNSA